jgi:four helix bundle protein
MQDFRRLRVWRAAHELALRVYAVTWAFPPDERFGLTAQVRRSAASVPANIAESCGRGGGRDQARFPQVALGSASELESHLLLARDLGVLSLEGYQELAATIEAIKKMLTGLRRRVIQAQTHVVRGRQQHPRTTDNG